MDGTTPCRGRLEVDPAHKHPKGRFVLRADAIRPYSCGGTARTMPVDSLEKILCRISIAIIRIFRYNRKDTRQVYAGGLWGVLRRLFVMI